MKFAVVLAVTLALAMSVQASFYPWAPYAPYHAEVAGHGLSYTAVSGPAHAHYGAYALLHPAHAPAAVAIHESPAHYEHAALVYAPHAYEHAYAHAHAHAHAPALLAAHPHEAHYVAQNRGALHSAPLPGHTQSASSVNLEPAPGTH